MLNNNDTLRAIAGGLLAFYGAKLLGMSLQDRPDNYIMFAAIAIAFIAIGTIYAVKSINNYMKRKKENEIEINETEIDEMVKGENDSCE